MQQIWPMPNAFQRFTLELNSEREGERSRERERERKGAESGTEWLLLSCGTAAEKNTLVAFSVFVSRRLVQQVPGLRLTERQRERESARFLSRPWPWLWLWLGLCLCLSRCLWLWQRLWHAALLVSRSFCTFLNFILISFYYKYFSFARTLEPGNVFFSFSFSSFFSFCWFFIHQKLVRRFASSF